LKSDIFIVEYLFLCKINKLYEGIRLIRIGNLILFDLIKLDSEISLLLYFMRIKYNQPSRLLSFHNI